MCTRSELMISNSTTLQAEGHKSNSSLNWSSMQTNAAASTLHKRIQVSPETYFLPVPWTVGQAGRWPVNPWSTKQDFHPKLFEPVYALSAQLITRKALLKIKGQHTRSKGDLASSSIVAATQLIAIIELYM